MTADSRLRVFIAVDLPDDVKAEMGSVIESIDALKIRGIRTVRAQGLHITLRFLGDVESEDVPNVYSAMTIAAAATAPFDLALTGTGAFPDSTAPRTLWAGVEGDLDKLSTLQGSVQSALETARIVRVRERFSPHITIARVRSRMSVEDNRRVTTTIEDALRSPIAVSVNSIAVMRSTPRRGGSIYTPLRTVPIGPDRSPRPV